MLQHLRKMSLIILVGVLVMAVILAGCSGEETAYDKVMDRGKLIVGTSADYPPFEFVNDAGEFDGFDMEIIKEIADRMDLDIEIRDMGFDTLIATVQQGRVDCLIASMSATPERREQVDYTDIYYSSGHGFLMKVGSDVQLSAPEEMADYKVGVQTGTSHEKWLMDNLVDEGEMSDDDVLRYEKADQGIMDVIAERIDIFIADGPVARDYAKEMPEVEVRFEYDLNPVYGGTRIMVAKGEHELRDALNDVLAELKEEGFIEALEEKWIYSD
ncbi:MAG: ABC transporter substrate-binding protein [Bacillota bacterium]